jgi:hypothetical protein
MRLFHGPIAVPPEIVAYPATAWFSKARAGRSGDYSDARALTGFRDRLLQWAIRDSNL